MLYGKAIKPKKFETDCVIRKANMIRNREIWLVDIGYFADLGHFERMKVFATSSRDNAIKMAKGFGFVFSE